MRRISDRLVQGDKTRGSLSRDTSVFLESRVAEIPLRRGGPSLMVGKKKNSIHDVDVDDREYDDEEVEAGGYDDNEDAYLACESSDDDVDSDDEDIDIRLEYLHEKQTILKRVADYFSQEEAYDASIALGVVAASSSKKQNGTKKQGENKKHAEGKQQTDGKQDNKEEPSIWDEAEEVLNKLGKRPDKRRTTAVTPTSSSRGRPSSIRGGKKSAPNPCHPKITLGGVGHVRTSSYKRKHRSRSPEDGHTNTTTTFGNGTSSLDVQSVVHHHHHHNQQAVGFSNNNNNRGLTRSCMFPEAQWMARALAKSSSSGNNSSPAGSTSSASLGGVIAPPCNIISMKNTITIQDALAFSGEARLITQSIPPFGVVFANKALLLLAGLSSSNSVIGQPVESILEVKDNNNNNNNDSRLRATLRLVGVVDGNGSNSNNNNNIKSTSTITRKINIKKACHIRVFPVVDRARGHRRLSVSPGGAASGKFSQDTSSSQMSHVLINVYERHGETMSTADADLSAQHGATITAGDAGLTTTTTTTTPLPTPPFASSSSSLRMNKNEGTTPTKTTFSGCPSQLYGAVG